MPGTQPIKQETQMPYSSLLLEKHDDGVARITLNRPNEANTLSAEMCRELMLAAIECDEDPDVRAVLLDAKGKLFSGGGDIAAFSAAGGEVGKYVKEMTIYLHAAFSRFARMRAPLVVAVNGAAAGAGFSLAVAGDLVYAARSASFTLGYTALGVSPDGGASYLLPRLIGLRRTQELLYTNRRLKAEEAQHWGLVNFVVNDEDLQAEAEKAARKLAQGPTNAYGRSKHLLLGSFDNGLESQMELEARAIVAGLTSADGQEGLAAFLEKRKPGFKG
jgi:2-(1,2-epoxy-1,2-dihydrophenyl)acetyl-CoA isomerase